MREGGAGKTKGKSAALGLAAAALLMCAPAAAGPTIRSIHIEGNRKTLDSTIMGELGFRVGDEYSPELLSRARRRLLNTRLFSRVEVDADEDAAGADITIRVQERWSFLILPYGSSEGGVSTYGLAVLDSNAFGTGDLALGAVCRSSDGRTSWMLQWDARRIAGPWGGSAVIYHEAKRRREYDDHDVANKYDSDIAGGNAVLTYEIAEDLRIGAGGGFASHGYDTVDDYTRKPADHDVAFLRAQVEYDGVDWEGDATRGFYGIVWSDWAEHAWGSEEAFIKLEAQAELDVPVGDVDTAVFSAGAAWGSGVPYGERFGLGGADTLRGYYPREFLGDRMLRLGAEYRRPLLRRDWGTISAVGFVDTGQAWLQGQSLHASDWQTGVGGGLRVYLADVLIPAVRLETAYGLDADDWAVHFAIGSFD